MGNRAQPFDACIVCSLYEEAEAVLNEFSTHCKVSFISEFSSMDLYEYRYTTIQNNQGEPLTVLVTWLADNGPVRTGLHLKPFLQEFHPRFAAMTGICAGYKEKDIRLGDLIVAEYAYHYEVGKDTLGKDGQKKHELQTITYGLTPQVLQYVRSFQDWREPVAKLKRPKRKQEKINTSEPLKEGPPTCYIAPMASGMAVKEDEPFPWLREHINRKTLALEMEAATFYLTLQEVSSLGIHSLVVKGVSDYADGSKNDEYHKYAERASAIYLLYFIRKYVNSTTMPRRDASLPSSRDGPSRVWNVPHRRNPLFTGRGELLDQLQQQLTPVGQNQPVQTRRVALTQPRAIKGLGGIGKTQIAVEYAYRSRDLDLYLHTLWINAANKETIITSFVMIAELLPSFSAKHETDQQKLVEAVKQWLEECEQPWLLIFDNVDSDNSLSQLTNYLPQQGKGSILLTTRADAVGPLAVSINVEEMDRWEGTLFLLHRAQLFEHTSILDASDEEAEVVNAARGIVDILESFPLALEQAGAYIEETKSDLTDYLQIYQDHRKDLLARHGHQITNDYPDIVATTWSLSLQKVEQANPAAAELLRLCAFLAPDRIPEELIREGADYWSPLLQISAADLFTFNQMIEELLKFSLIKRLAEDHMLSIHRLVQAVQRDMMGPEVQCQWAEQVVRAVNKVFPNSDTTTWQQCLRYLPQAQVCNILIEQYTFMFAEAAGLLTKTAAYLADHAFYALAEPLCQRTVQIYKQVLGPIHHDTASSLDQLGYLYWRQGKFEEAESLLQQGLEIREQVLAPTHLDIAASYANLGGLYREWQIKDTQAEQLQQQAIEIYEQLLGPAHLRTAVALHNLGWFYSIHGRYKEAEPLFGGHRRSMSRC